MAKTADAPETPIYRLTAQVYLHRLLEADQVVPWDGPPNRAMVPLNAAAEAAVEAAAAARAARAKLVEVVYSTAQIPTVGLVPPGADVASLRKRAEDAEYTVAERDEEIARLKAELAAKDTPAPAPELEPVTEPDSAEKTGA